MIITTGSREFYVFNPVVLLTDIDSDSSQRPAKRRKQKASARAKPKNRREPDSDSIAALAACEDLNTEQRETLFTAAQTHFGEGTVYMRAMLQTWQPDITEHNSSQILMTRNILATNEMARRMQEAKMKRPERRVVATE